MDPDRNATTVQAGTGISTGALIAPFAFLGPAYDKELKELYTGISFKDVAKKRSIFSVVANDAMADNTPLKNLVKKHINQDVLGAIAAEYAKGRMLLIGTVNLDAHRPVIWNITEIAAGHHPAALELVQSLLIASSAIPGIADLGGGTWRGVLTLVLYRVCDFTGVEDGRVMRICSKNRHHAHQTNRATGTFPISY